MIEGRPNMKYLFLLLFNCLFVPGYSQDIRQMDSLLKVLDTQKENAGKLHSLETIAGILQKNGNVAKALVYCDSALALANKLGSKQDVAIIYNIMWRSSDFDGAMKILTQLSALYGELNEKGKLADTYIEMADIFIMNSLPRNSTRLLDSAELIIHEIKDSIRLCRLYNYRGTIFDKVPPYDSAIYYYKKELALATQIKNENYIFEAMKNLAACYTNQNNTQLALQYFDTLLGRMDTAFNSRNDPGQVYSLLGATWLKTGNYAKALHFFTKSLNIVIRRGNKPMEADLYGELAKTYAAMKDYKMQSFYLTKYYSIREGIFNSDNKNQLIQLEADYQLEKKNAVLARQEAETSRQKSQRNIFIFITIGSVLLLVASAFFYNRIKEKNKLLAKQKVELQYINGVKDRLFSIISHDLRSPLATLKNYFSLIDNPTLDPGKKEKYTQQTLQAVNQTSDMLDNLLVWARVQLKNLSPNIAVINIEECIDDAIAAVKFQAERKNINIKKSIRADAVPTDYTILEIALRNIISNAVKFSHINADIYLSTYKMDNKVVVEIKDDGVGMTATQIEALLTNKAESTAGTKGEHGTGLGMLLVMELLKKTGAELLIESEKDKGCKFMIVL